MHAHALFGMHVSLIVRRVTGPVIYLRRVIDALKQWRLPAALFGVTLGARSGGGDQMEGQDKKRFRLGRGDVEKRDRAAVD